MKLTLIRHTRVNIPPGMIYGQTDVPLASTFDQEAKSIINQLTLEFDAVYSSPLSRCQLLAKKIALEVTPDDRLKELNFGNWEGKFWDEISQTPEAQKWFDNYMEMPCPKGESYFDMLHRIQLFYSGIIHAGHKNICIITHGGSIRAFISIIEELNPQKAFDRKIEFGEIIRYKIPMISSSR